ncbi:MAG: hypothetical protein H7Y86_17040 [Rhizobacter sp.]|nr:hypothetical protein [Ferruginibacter sp.]
MKKIVLLCLLAFATGLCYAQFPQNFIGEWKGKLQWIVTGKPLQEFAMRLRIAASDSLNRYIWHISYGDSNKDTRPYMLSLVDREKNHWVIEEGNGINLDNYVAGNCLQGSFTVMNNTIVNNYCIEDGKMRVEFFTIKLADKKTSGNGTKDSPLVDNYRMAGYQHGLLEKVR